MARNLRHHLQTIAVLYVKALNLAILLVMAVAMFIITQAEYIVLAETNYHIALLELVLILVALIYAAQESGRYLESRKLRGK